MAEPANALFDFGFLIHDVLSNDWIKLFHFKLVWLSSFVLVSRVEMSGTGAGYHSDLVAHDRLPFSLDPLASGSHVGQDFIYTLFVDYTHAFGRNAQPNKSLLRFHPKAVMVKIG